MFRRGPESSRRSAQLLDVGALQARAPALEQTRLALVDPIELVGERRLCVIFHPGLAEMPIFRLHRRRAHFAREPVVLFETENATRRRVAVDLRVKMALARIDRPAGR